MQILGREAKHIAVVAVAGLLGTLMVADFWIDSARDRALRGGSKTISARVVDLERRDYCIKGSCEERYWAKYAFQQAGQTYHFVGLSATSLLRPSVKSYEQEWARVTKQEWLAAHASLSVAVLYSPRNPWINQPLSNKQLSTSHPGWLVNAALFFGIAIFVYLKTKVRSNNSFKPKPLRGSA